jgi:quinolinate synthase
LWPGYCSTHVLISAEDIKTAKEKYPDAIVMVHPECNEPVKALADEILSTGQMLKFVVSSSAKHFIVATEKGIIHSLKKKQPDAEFIPATERAICPNMKKIGMDKVLWSLEDMQYKIEVPQEIASKAKLALERMVEVVPTN